MYLSVSVSWIFLVLYAQYAVGQTAGSTLDAASCNPGSPLTTFSACNWLDNQISYCAGPQVATGAPFVSCYCNQKVFNAIYEFVFPARHGPFADSELSSCESEYRLCLGNNDFDGEEQELLSIWNSACDNVVTFTPTTPALSTLTATYDDQYCTTAYSACEAAAADQQACSASYLGKDVQKFSSCFCAPPILSEGYTCGFLGNVSCRQVPATLTNLPEYPFCDNFMQVLGTAGPGNVRWPQERFLSLVFELTFYRQPLT